MHFLQKLKQNLLRDPCAKHSLLYIGNIWHWSGWTLLFVSRWILFDIFLEFFNFLLILHLFVMIWNIDMLDFVLFMVSDFCLQQVEIYRILEVCLIWFQTTENSSLNVELKQSLTFVLRLSSFFIFSHLVLLTNFSWHL